MEDPRLHETAIGWRSAQHLINMAAVAFLVIFSGLLILMLWLRFAVGALIISVIIAIIILWALYTNFDGKDHWMLELPYNDRLFHALDEGISRKLREGNFVHAAIPWKTTVFMTGAGAQRGSAYTIKASDGSWLEVSYALLKVKQKHGYSYHFPLEIRDARRGNLEEAHILQAKVNEALIEVDYLNYMEEHE